MAIFYSDEPRERVSLSRNTGSTDFSADSDHDGDSGGILRGPTSVEQLERMLCQRTEELRESENRFRNIITRNIDGILIVDTDGVLRFLNPSAETMLGRSAERLLGQQIGFPIVAGDRTEVDIFRGGGETAVAEMRAVETEWGGQQAVLCSLRDVTERKQLIEEKIRLLKSEQEARKVAEVASRAKDEFLATLSHELRTPLTAIMGWARMLNSGKLDHPTSVRGLEVIIRNVHTQLRLIDDILDLSRIIRGKLRLEQREIELATVIDAAIDSVRPAADGKNITINRDVGGSTVLNGDPDRLQQVIWNVLSNSIKFTPRCGQVHVRLRQQQSHAVLTISDNGEGIEASFLPHLFDRFRQADPTSTRNHGGLGLGLAIARHIIEMHGGSISAESAGPGCGSTFTICLPIRHCANAQPPRSPEIILSSEDKRSLQGARVLLVEDEACLRDLFAMTIAQYGAVVTAVESADDALKELQKNIPDVLMTDIAMPAKDGYELLQEVRRRNINVPAVALTAHARREDQLKAVNAGFQAHVSKPVEPTELASVIATLLKKRQ
ncbi:MAG TPA: ATP-binding protein [Planctomycetota bacterium]|nr:ATP-binding protein [Planctomycetota bacterium]